MKMRTRLIMNILIELIAINYWCYGYLAPASILLASCLIVNLYYQKTKLLVSVAFFGMILFTSYCLLFARLAPQLVLSGFSILFFMLSILNSNLLLMTIAGRYKVRVLWQKVTKMGWILYAIISTLILFGDFSLLQWLSFVVPSLSRTSAAILAAFLFLPVLAIPMLAEKVTVKSMLVSSNINIFERNMVK